MLDDVAWADLTHAYGSAVNVPDLIRGLASPDEEAARDALDELRGSILHQGGIESSTAPAVPFLVALAQQPAIHHRGNILWLVADMADLRDPADAAPVVVAVDKAVSAYAKAFIELLADPDPWVREVAAVALAQCRRSPLDRLTPLLDRWETETDEAVRISVLLAAAKIDPATPLVAEALSDRHPPAMRAAAALRSDFSPAAVEAVAAAWREAEPFPLEPYGSYVWFWDPPLTELVERAADHYRPVLAALLGSKAPDVRLAAGWQAHRLLLSRRSARPALVPELVPLLSDDSADVRATAARAIWGAGSASAVAADELAAIAGGDDDAGVLATVALIELGDPRAPVDAAVRSGRLPGPLGRVLAAQPREPAADLGADALSQLRKLAIRQTDRPYEWNDQLAAARKVWLATGDDSLARKVIHFVLEREARPQAADLAADIGDSSVVPLLRKALPTQCRVAAALWRLTNDPTGLAEPLTRWVAEAHDWERALPVAAAVGVPLDHLIDGDKARFPTYVEDSSGGWEDERFVAAVRSRS